MELPGKLKLMMRLILKKKPPWSSAFSDESLDLYFDWIITPELNEAGDVDCLLAIGRSLTERKKFEKTVDGG